LEEAVSLFTILQMTGSALQAQRAGLAVTANNIANAGTDGYHRQSIEFRTVGTYSTNGLLLGAGVSAEDVLSAYDKFTEERLYAEHSNSGYAESMASAYEVLESMVAVADEEGSLASRLSSLLTSIDAMAVTPWESSVRTQVLIDAEALASEFRRQAESLDDLSQTSDEAIAISAESLTDYLAEIAALNAQIASLESSGQTANDLRDQRGAYVDQVASLADVVLDEESDGTLTLFVAGHAVVQGAEAQTISAVEDAGSGTNRVVLDAGGVALDITDQISSGSLAAHIEIRDQIIPALAADLDQNAYDLITNFNAVHVTGYDLDGNPGGNFFMDPGSADGAAATMQLDSGLQDNPDGLAAAASAADVPGDGTIAIALGDLGDQQLAGGGTMTFNEALSGFVAQLASDTAAVKAGLTLQTGITSAIESAWESRSAVSQEEEAINLIEFQDAYDALARVLQATQAMLDTLMEI